MGLGIMEIVWGGGGISARGGMDCGRVWGCGVGWGGNRFNGRFLGRGRVFWWWVVWIYRKTHFTVVRALKRLLSHPQNKRPAGGYLVRKTKGAVIFPPPDKISNCLITLSQNPFAIFELLQNGF